MESWDRTAVRARLEEAAAHDRAMERFGADTHRYTLRPPLPEPEIRAFETVHGIALPPQYRSFVAEVGDGPAGPAHGLLPLTTPRLVMNGPRAGEIWFLDPD